MSKGCPRAPTGAGTGAAPGAVAGLATPDQVQYWLQLAHGATVECLVMIDPYTEPFDYDIDTTVVGRHGLMDASYMLDAALAFLDAAGRNSDQAFAMYGQHQQYLARNINGYRCHNTTGVPYPTS